MSSKLAENSENTSDFQIAILLQLFVMKEQN